MKLSQADVSLDLGDYQARADAWEAVRTAMKIGLITPENFTWEDRNTVRTFFERLPIIEPVDARSGKARIIGEADLIEGRDWCFATSRDGTFGVFPLDELSQDQLRGATMHLWPDSSYDYGVRQDFDDLGRYQEAALDAALSYGVAV